MTLNGAWCRNSAFDRSEIKEATEKILLLMQHIIIESRNITILRAHTSSLQLNLLETNVKYKIESAWWFRKKHKRYTQTIEWNLTGIKDVWTFSSKCIVSNCVISSWSSYGSNPSWETDVIDNANVFHRLFRAESKLKRQNKNTFKTNEILSCHQKTRTFVTWK